jgi:hypothetical protein
VSGYKNQLMVARSKCKKVTFCIFFVSLMSWIGVPSVHAVVFFEEGWESGTKTQTFNSQYYGNLGTNSNFTVQSAVRASGNYALRFTFEAGQMVPLGGTQHIADSAAGPVFPVGQGNHYQDLYIQYKIYYSPGFDFSLRPKQFIIGTQDDRRHDDPCCNPWVADYITTESYDGFFGTELNNKRAASGQWWGLNPNMNGYSTPSNEFRIQTGRWYTLEFRRRLNTAQNNGIFQMWVDGVQVADYQDVPYRIPWNGSYGTNYNYGTNFVMISNYIARAPAQTQYVYFDDVKFSDTYIGIGTTPPPPPPANRCDLSGNNTVDVSDVQQCANQATGASTCGTGDINQDSSCNVVDVQRVVNAALGGQCVTAP